MTRFFRQNNYSRAGVFSLTIALQMSTVISQSVNSTNTDNADTDSFKGQYTDYFLIGLIVNLFWAMFAFIYPACRRQRQPLDIPEELLAYQALYADALAEENLIAAPVAQEINCAAIPEQEREGVPNIPPGGMAFEAGDAELQIEGNAMLLDAENDEAQSDVIVHGEPADNEIVRILFAAPAAQEQINSRVALMSLEPFRTVVEKTDQTNRNLQGLVFAVTLIDVFLNIGSMIGGTAKDVEDSNMITGIVLQLAGFLMASITFCGMTKFRTQLEQAEIIGSSYFQFQHTSQEAGLRFLNRIPFFNHRGGPLRIVNDDHQEIPELKISPQ